jgi:MoaA/NifB/PqqE/SkfB family radical SAM enzyme
MALKNRIAFMSTLLKDRLLNKSTPLTVVINITSRCNLKCGYCYGEYYKNKDKDFTTKELLKLIDDLAKLGTRSITLAGGEPLLRPDIGQIIKKVKKLGIECGMNTNGILIPKRLKELSIIDTITVSLDGPQKVNDLNRGSGSSDKIMQGIEASLSAGIKTLSPSIIVKPKLLII